MMGLTWFRQREIVETATRELTDVISKQKVIANDDSFDVSAISFTGNTVSGKQFALAA